MKDFLLLTTISVDKFRNIWSVLPTCKWTLMPGNGNNFLCSTYTSILAYALGQKKSWWDPGSSTILQVGKKFNKSPFSWDITRQKYRLALSTASRRAGISKLTSTCQVGYADKYGQYKLVGTKGFLHFNSESKAWKKRGLTPHKKL